MLFSRAYGCLRAPTAIPRVATAIAAHIPPCTKRTFTAISIHRPTISSFRSTTQRLSSVLPSATTSPSIVDGTILDLMPKISTHPALGAMQIRCGPRNTFSPSHFVRKRRHGFLSRTKTRTGRAILKRRRLKGRNTLSH